MKHDFGKFECFVYFSRSVSDMLEHHCHQQLPHYKLDPWPCIQTRLVVFYKIIHQHLAMYPKIFEFHQTTEQDTKYFPLQTNSNQYWQ
jgi:hypothetical protein